MRLFLQQLPVGNEPPRFVQLVLEQDLLGGWTLMREVGQIGGKSQLRKEQFLEQGAATAAFEKARDQHVKKGFQIMFSRGANAPR